jgi:Ca2+-binding RTX toxin-like protein
LFAGTYEKTSVAIAEVYETYSDGSTWLIGTQEVTVYVFDDVFSEWLFGGAGNDKLYGGYGSDYLDGGSGNDWLEGDYMAGLAFMATPEEYKNMLNDTFIGGAGDDTIIAGDGTDIINGGKGLDTIDLTEKQSVADKVTLEMTVSATSEDADTIKGFTSRVDTLIVASYSLPKKTALVIPSKIAAGANTKASIEAIKMAANSNDANIFYINNSNGLSLAQIEAAVTDGNAAVGEKFFLVEDKTDTFLYVDLNAHVDSGDGKGMVLLAKLVGVQGGGALATGDLMTL